MKLNTRLVQQYTTEPFEVQQLDDNVSVELHYMNDNPFYGEYAFKARFAIWATLDGIKYYLFIDKGYYEVMKELYDKETNTLWLQFWLKIDKMRNTYSKAIFFPALVVYFILLFVLAEFVFGNTGVIIIGALLAIVLSMFGNALLTSKMQKENVKAVNNIKALKGAKKFEKLLKEQDKYAAKFFEYEDELEETNEEVVNTEKTDEEVLATEKTDEVVEELTVEDNTAVEEVIEENEEISEEEKNE